MSIDELEHKEHVLRECFMEKLRHLNVDGDNDVSVIKCIKTYGALWHYTHQLLMAEDKGSGSTGNTSAETMNIQATGLKMSK